MFVGIPRVCHVCVLAHEVIFIDLNLLNMFNIVCFHTYNRLHLHKYRLNLLTDKVLKASLILGLVDVVQRYRACALLRRLAKNVCTKTHRCCQNMQCSTLMQSHTDMADMR